MTKTKIEWADRVWNPVTGCSKVSAGCKNCYAETIAKRFWGERKFTDVVCHSDRIAYPLKWKKPARVFVNSMSDLFHPDVPDEFIYLTFKMMSLAPMHMFMILTKRPERMQDLIGNIRSKLPDRLNHVWLGVSVEDQKAADKRIPILLQTPAAVRFVSVEPMLDRVDLTWINYEDIVLINALNGDHGFPIPHAADQNHRKLDWVICGSESGVNARPFDFDWARSLRDQCVASGVPFFFKQAPGKKMPELDEQVWAQYPGGQAR